MHALQQLYQRGLLPEAEARALKLLASYPKSIALYNLLGLCQQAQGKLREAVASFRSLLAIDAGIAEIHFNLAAILTQLNDSKAAIAGYRKALAIKPTLTVAHFNLGALLQAQGLLQEAAQHYRQAATLEPGFVAAHGNLGTILQQQGLLEAAECCYRHVLALRPDALTRFNLGTTLYGLGRHEQAIDEFRAALELDTNNADAWNSLGETLRDQGVMDEALRCYRQALALQPDHGRASYNLGEFHCLLGRTTEAIAYFERSDFADAQERALQCLYKSGRFADYKRRFDELIRQSRPMSILLGTLSTHYASNFRESNPYPFCADPMAYVVHTRIDELAAPDSPLRHTLLHDIAHLAIAERKQGRLYYGVQSAGNLLQRAEPSFQQLAGLIRAKVALYRRQFAGSADELIRSFPRDVAFASSWYLRMKQGGYLTSHIHEEGWISGCVYLKLPDRQRAHEGSFEYGTDGDDYPRLHDDFPSRIVDQAVGDLVLFPSSLFHRTLPFSADQERVCVAFDVKPA